MESAGWTFSPSDDNLTDDYLRSLIDHRPLPDVLAAVIHHDDVYSATPEKLVEGREPAPGTGNGDKRVWYFFTSVRYVGKKAKNARGGDGKGYKCRTIAAGAGRICKWHSEAAAKEVKDSAVGGRFQKFSYKVQSATDPKKFDAGGWLMTEYSVPSASDLLVLCKIYRSPRTSWSEGSAASTSPCAAAMADTSCSGTKRKAAAGGHPAAPPSTRPRLQIQTASSGEFDLHYSVQQQTEQEEEDGQGLCFPVDGPAPMHADLDILASWNETATATYAPSGEDMIGVTSEAADDGKLVFFDAAGVTIDDLFAAEDDDARQQPATPSAATEEDAGRLLRSGADGGDKIMLSDAGVNPDDLSESDPAAAALGGCQEPTAAAAACGSTDELVSASGSKKWETTDSRVQVLSTYVPPPVRYEDEDDDDYYLQLWNPPPTRLRLSSPVRIHWRHDVRTADPSEL